ncbi:DKNYY domain-containing protein [Mucilaginibacter auburnensis]|uniref:DKNYY domain-containing protein n=1 Tax=Mucilaginibacter auburnensis TaxID=1457233 RepID=UPI001472E0DB|nr:DKNYY domain-containing protein [Mucilaginibacter auburnensis]
MKNYTIFFGLLLTSLLIGCRQGYVVENGHVFYEYWNEVSGQNKKLLEKADAGTFQKIDFDCGCSFTFGKDKKSVYIDGKQIENIDPNSFKFIGNYTFADKDSVYFFGFYNDLNECAIKGVSPNKITLLKYPWSKSGKILIHGNDTIHVGDIEEFIPVDEDWGKTKKKVINKNKILIGADPATFEVINSYSGKDKYHVYEFGKIKE